MLMWLVLLYALRVAHGSETCQNYPASVQPSSFREGDWFDQVRVYSGSHDYVSQFHPSETVSMFLAKYHTNCGYFELKTLSKDAFEFNKGHYVPRFQEHFYPFRAVVTRNYSDLSCRISLERSHCKSYVALTGAVHKISVLMTDYSSFMILHQCIDNKNYIMMLTKKEKLYFEEKIGINGLLIDVMNDFGIIIENRTFWWPTIDKCDELIGNIFPLFYRKVYIDRNQPECPANLTVELVNLKDFWKDKVESAENLWMRQKTTIICVVVMFAGTFTILGVFAIFLDNYKQSRDGDAESTRQLNRRN